MFKVIKFKHFEVAIKDAKGADTGQKAKHTHYTVAYKGRVFGVNTLRFDEGAITFNEKDMTLKIEGQLEMKKEQLTDQVSGEVTTVVNLMPKLDLVFAEF